MAGYKGSDQEQWSLIYLPYLIFVLHRKTKKQVHKTQQLKLQKSIHPRAVGGRKGKWKGNGTGRKSIQISPGTGLANARKELQKNLWSFQTHQCLKSILVSGRFCLTCTREKIQIPQREGNVCRALPLISLWLTPLHSDKSALVLLSLGSNKTLSPHKILFLCVNPNPPPNFL